MIRLYKGEKQLDYTEYTASFDEGPTLRYAINWIIGECMDTDGTIRVTNEGGRILAAIIYSKGYVLNRTPGNDVDHTEDMKMIVKDIKGKRFDCFYSTSFNFEIVVSE